MIGNSFLKVSVRKLKLASNCCRQAAFPGFNPEGLACGRCDSWQIRLKEFKEAGWKDPIRYASEAVQKESVGLVDDRGDCFDIVRNGQRILALHVFKARLDDFGHQPLHIV